MVTKNKTNQKLGKFEEFFFYEKPEKFLLCKKREIKEF